MKRSPTRRLLVGLLVTLAAVASFSWYSLHQLSGLRELQTNTINRDRKDSLLLLRVQNDLHELSVSLRDMDDRHAPYGIAGYQGEFKRLHTDLDDALEADAREAPPTRAPAQQERLRAATEEFWRSADELFAVASSGREALAQQRIRTRLLPQQASLAALVANLLQNNYEAEEQAASQVASIYEGVERETYIFLAGTLVLIALTTTYLIYSNNRLFDRLQTLSRQRRVLSGRLITVQEEVLRSVSRELHDEFGQILTAVGAMLLRAERKGLPPDSPFRAELSEVREIVQSTLEKMRSLSQMLHPTVLDDYGLARALEWYGTVFERQTGITVRFHTEGEVVSVTGRAAIHCYRIVQEALNNAAKHARTDRAELTLRFAPRELRITVRDHGIGFAAERRNGAHGLGLIAMQERSRMMRSQLEVRAAQGGGTEIVLTVPLPQDDSQQDIPESEDTFASHSL